MTTDRFFDVPKRTQAEQSELNKPKVPLAPSWYTTHGGRPKNRKEWADHNFFVGDEYANSGVPEYELSTDWPDIFNNEECMDGYHNGWKDRE
jgi:hypothetical protein